MATIEADVLPRYSVLPRFLGFLALQSELGTRSEIVIITLPVTAGVIAPASPAITSLALPVAAEATVS